MARTTTRFTVTLGHDNITSAAELAGLVTRVLQRSKAIEDVAILQSVQPVARPAAGTYQAQYEPDVFDCETPLGAAIAAYQQMLDPESMPPILAITDSDGNVTEVDLNEHYSAPCDTSD